MRFTKRVYIYMSKYIVILLEQVSSFADNDIMMTWFSWTSQIKAFDKVPRQRILKILNGHGIHGKLFEWIKSWLNKWVQRVVQATEWQKFLLEEDNKWRTRRISFGSYPFLDLHQRSRFRCDELDIKVCLMMPKYLVKLILQLTV